MNVPKYYAAKRTIHKKFQELQQKHTSHRHQQKHQHHVVWSSLLLDDLHQMEHKHASVLQKDMSTSYSQYLDELIDSNQEDKLFIHNYFHSMRTIAGRDREFSDGMRYYYDVESQYGRALDDFFMVQQVNESLRMEFVARVDAWSASEKVACMAEIRLAKAMMMEVLANVHD